MYRILLTMFMCMTTVSCAVNNESAHNVDSERWQQFLAWWPGEYDNSRQFAAQSALPHEDRLPHTRMHIQRVDAPAFGEFVYYAEWQAYADASNVLRQRFYAFEKDGPYFRLNLHIFPTDPEFVKSTSGAYRDSSRLAGLTPDDMYPLAGCDVYFQWAGSDFAGAMRKGECKFEAPGTSKPIYSWSQMKIQPRVFSYRDVWFQPDGTPYQRLMADWIVLDKSLP